MSTVRLPILLLLIASVTAFVSLQGLWPPDLSAVYFGARAYGLGFVDHIYTAPEGFFGRSVDDPVWRQMATELGHGDELILPYIYPPFTAMILSPIAKLVSPTAFFTAALVFNIACSAATFVLAWRIAARRPDFMTWTSVSVAIALTAFAFVFAHFQHQPHIFVTFLIMAAFERYSLGRMASAGALLAFAAAIKLSPAFFVIIFLADRNWRAFFACALTGAVLLLGSILIGGVALHLDFVAQISRLGSADQVLSNSSYSIAGAITQLQYVIAGIAFETGQEFLLLPHSSVGRGVALLLFVPGTALLLWHTRDIPGRLFIRLLGLWLILVLADPLSWALYAIGPLSLLPGLITRLPKHVAIGAVVIAGIGLSFQLFQLDLATSHIPFPQSLIAVITLLGLLGLTFKLTPPK
ncbi:glycosyltransferase family 87 protein [Aestuariibius sp. HNIBRBA575]|uniref:glycosyltransferase family 87 protein n=1 Tax=Aestuariibius sp. HNIBRBA575 TaxID=3233343 RepID=UPI0034A13B69